MQDISDGIGMKSLVLRSKKYMICEEFDRGKWMGINEREKLQTESTKKELSFSDKLTGNMAED